MTIPTDNPEPDKRYCGCCYCGKCWEYEGREPSDELVKEVGDHESVCPKNPYTNRIKELETALKVMQINLQNREADLRLAVEIARKIAGWLDPEHTEDSPEFSAVMSEIDKLEATLNPDKK